MISPERQDPYSAIAVISPQKFELSGENGSVPLLFRPDAGFLLKRICEIDTSFTTSDLVEMPGFAELCDDVYPRHRFAYVFSHLRLTMGALGSTLIQPIAKRGSATIYNRNPRYLVTPMHVQPQLMEDSFGKHGADERT
jgi:hypothetical protein